MDINGTVSIVTGGNGGLGQRICQALAEAGSAVIVMYSQRRAEAEAIATSIRAIGAQSEAVQCDVTDEQQVNAMSAHILENFGMIDILINDAAYNKWIPYQDLESVTPAVWNKIISVNLTGPLLCMKAVAPAMKNQGNGRIVNISSVAGLIPTGSSIPYAVSKAGLIHLTRCMAVALAPEVLVNCIAPGFLEGTRATTNLDPGYQERAKANSLLKRAADKDDIAQQIVSLCRSDSITGQTIVIDSGRVLH